MSIEYRKNENLPVPESSSIDSSATRTKPLPPKDFPCEPKYICERVWDEMRKSSLNWICHKGFQIPPTEDKISKPEASTGRVSMKVPPSCGCNWVDTKEKDSECFSMDRINAALQNTGSLPLSDPAVSMLNLPDPNEDIAALELSLADIEEILNDLPTSSQQLDTIPQSLIPVTASSETFHTQASRIRLKSAQKRKANDFAATVQANNPRAESDKRRKESIANLAEAVHAQSDGPSEANVVLASMQSYTSPNVLSGSSNLAATFNHEDLENDLENIRNLDDLAAEALQWLEDEPIDAMLSPTADLPVSSDSQLSQIPNDHVSSQSLDAEGLMIAALLDAEQEPPSLSQIFASGGSMMTGIAEPHTGPLSRLMDTGAATDANTGHEARFRAGGRTAEVYPGGLPAFL